MRSSCCQNMTDTCNAMVYATNPFHLIGLSPFANSKSVRRRKEDLESAEAMGGAAWKDEFRHLLGNVQVPSPEEVSAAFRRIEDPQQRIVDEFFWFWPLDDHEDKALDALQEGKKAIAVKIWEKEEMSGDIRRSAIARHNVAIYNHFYAIDGEWQFIKNNVPAISSTVDCANLRRKMLKYWNVALECWGDVADDEDFWDVVRERVSDIDDKRLTTGFVRRMRDEFPIAFDRINGDLVVEYARLPDRHAEVQRHLRYMNESHRGLDDVEATLDAIFDPIEREVELLIQEAGRVRKATPNRALSAARTLLQNSAGIRKMADEILGKDHHRRIKIFDKIASECNFCQVAYGNETKQWEECLGFIKEVIPLACGEDLIGVLNSNLNVVTKNFEDYKLRNYCWFCQKHPADPNFAIEIKMYGNVRIQAEVFSRQYRTTWNNALVVIPRCKHCGNAKVKRDEKQAESWNAYQAARDRRGGWDRFWDIETSEMKACKQKYDEICAKNGRINENENARQEQFPLYAELKKEGFTVGDKPSDLECQTLYEKRQRELELQAKETLKRRGCDPRIVDMAFRDRLRW